MLYVAVLFFVIGIVAAVFGVAPIAAGAAGIAKALLLLGKAARIERETAPALPRT